MIGRMSGRKYFSTSRVVFPAQSLTISKEVRGFSKWDSHRNPFLPGSDFCAKYFFGLNYRGTRQ